MYSNNEDFNWFSQTLMTHKDKFYGTDGYLRVSIGTGTENYKSFNPPVIGISISNQLQKNYNLTYSNVIDLINTLKLVKQQTNGNNSEIQRKYKKDFTLHIKFFVERNNNDSVVEIRLITSETDFTKIIIPMKVFSIVIKSLQHFSENYFDLCSQLLIQSIQAKPLEIIQQLPGLIKGISSQIVSVENPSGITFPDRSAPISVEEKENSQKTEATIDDLDNFLGPDLENIKITEIEEDEPKKPVVEINSPFTNQLIKNDLFNLEGMINNHTLNVNPIQTFVDEVHKQLSTFSAEDFTPLPELTEDDFKSLSYLTKLYYKIAYRSYLSNNSPFPNTMPVFKYPVENVKDENLEIAYDLLLFNLYIKLVRGRLESKVLDQTKNLSLFHIQLRCITDPFIFSFIKNTKQLNSIIINRYKFYVELGIFDHYTKLLESSNCSLIQEQEISSAVEEVGEKIINKSMNINELHEVMIPKNKLRLTTKNKFSLEQITKELIPMEVEEKLGVDVLNEEFLIQINKNTPISEEIIDLFNYEVKEKPISKVKQKYKNNLERVVIFFNDEIPKQHQEEFIKFIRNNDNKSINLNTIQFPLDEFGENIIKALYIWNPEDDPDLIKSYKHLQLKIEEEIMDKKLILTANKNAKVDEEKSEDGWGDMFTDEG